MHHAYLCDVLERVIKGDIKRLIITMPPGSAKSTYTSKLLPPFALQNHPRWNIIGVSNVTKLAMSFSAAAQQHIRDNGHVLDYGLATEAVEEWSTTMGGTYKAAGIGATIVGKRADLAIIDDPVSGRDEVENIEQRDKVWDWYWGTLRQRLKPSGRIIVMACMVGGTKVSMADGTEMPLRDIRPGDRIATYDDGAISASVVLNWASQGVDNVFEIITKSGIKTKANGRHPFLVMRKGGVEWVRLRHLKVGDKLVRTRSKGEQCEASFAQAPIVPNPQNAKGIATSIIANRGGKAASGLRRLIRKRGGPGSSDIAMASASLSMTPCSPLKTVFAEYAENLRTAKSRQVGPESLALITATPQGKSVVCSVTSATSPLAMEKPKKLCCGLRNTFETIPDQIVSITPCGMEEVFDIQVDRTENFIADGLVSHNTRWHEDDLIGRLIALQPKLWTVVNIKAEAEADDPLNRAPGEWLWSDPDDPFGYGIELAGKKAEMETVGSMREWYSQFQGGPRPTEGALFKTGRIQVLDVAPELRGATICRGWDFAATKQTGTRDPDWTVGVKLARLPSGLYVVLDVFRDRGGPNDVAGWLNNVGRQDGTGVKISFPQDPGQAGKSQAAFFTQMLSGLNFEHSLETGDKATRASPVISQCNGGNLAIVKAPWNAPFLDELTGFPSGAKDDQVDALSRAFSIVGLGARPLVFSADVIAALGRRR